MENRPTYTAKFFEAYDHTFYINELRNNVDTVLSSDLSPKEKEDLLDELVNENNDKLLGVYNSDVLFSEVHFKAPDEETTAIQPAALIGTEFGKHRGLRLIVDWASGDPEPKIMHNILLLEDEEALYNPDDDDGDSTPAETYYLIDINSDDVEIMQAPLTRLHRQKQLNRICKDIYCGDQDFTATELAYMYQRMLGLEVPPDLQRKYVDWLLDRIDLLYGLTGEKVEVYAHDYYEEDEHDNRIVDSKGVPIFGTLLGFSEMPAYSRDHPFAEPTFSAARTMLVACMEISSEDKKAFARIPLRRMASMEPAFEEYGKS